LSDGLIYKKTTERQRKDTKRNYEHNEQQVTSKKSLGMNSVPKSAAYELSWSQEKQSGLGLWF
jgi:hypothetical protein